MRVSDEIAYHEAGHAFMAVYVGARVRSITIEPDWDDGPRRSGDAQIEWRRSQLSPRAMSEKSVLVALAGPVAEMIHRCEPYHPGFVAEWAADWHMAWDAITPWIADERRRLEYLEQATVGLYQLLHQDSSWDAIAALVDELTAHETLDGDDVEEIVRRWLR